MLLVYALVKAPTLGWTDSTDAYCISALSVAALVGFIINEIASQKSADAAQDLSHPQPVGCQRPDVLHDGRDVRRSFSLRRSISSRSSATARSRQASAS